MESEKKKLHLKVEDEKRKEMSERFMNIAKEWDEPTMLPKKKARKLPEPTETIILSSPSPIRFKRESV